MNKILTKMAIEKKVDQNYFCQQVICLPNLIKYIIVSVLFFIALKSKAQSISISPISPLTYCAGSSLKISFVATGFPAGTIFNAELSNDNGDFSAPVNLGTSDTGSITGAISLNQSAGTKYRIRITTTGYVSVNNGSDIAISANPLPFISPTATPAVICMGSSSQLRSGISATNFNIDSVPYNRIPIPANALSGPFGDDELSDFLLMPFPFNFYGFPQDTFRICTNGNLQFGSRYYDSYTPIKFPDTPVTSNTVTNFVALCWGDQVLQFGGFPGGRIKYFVTGNTPDRKLVVDWDSCGWYRGFSPGSGFFSGQMQLFENGIIEFHLKAAMGFACCAEENEYRTMGVLNANGTIGDAPPGRNRGLWEVDSTRPEAWRFTPPGNYDYTWAPAASLNRVDKDTVIATPTVTTTYNVSATNQFTGCIAKGSLTTTVNPKATPNVSIAAYPSGPVSPNTSVTFTPIPVYGGTSPTYQWFKNGTLVSNAATYTSAGWNDDDSINCIMTSSDSCVTSPTASSNKIGIVLPLTLLDFQAVFTGKAVVTTWQTVQEFNTSHFSIQRGGNGTDFTDIGRLQAAGNSAEMRNYTFKDAEPNLGINYYRLQMADKDDKFTYSKIVVVNASINGGLSIYPNPVKNELFMQMQNDRAGKAQFQIIDAQGKIIQQESRQLRTGIQAFSFNTSRLSKGMYTLLIKGHQITSKTFIKK